MFNGCPANLKAIIQGMFALSKRVDYHVDFTSLNFFNDIRAAFMNLAYNLNINAH